jgi:membrane fusion protein
MALDCTTTLDDKEAGLAFLDATPPHWAARGMAYILILLFVSSATAAVLIQIPETVPCSFVLIPVRGADPIKAPRGGIITQVRITEGQTVTKGEPIFIIKSETVGHQTADVKSLNAEGKGAGESLVIARQRYESQRLADAQEAAKLTERIAHLSRMIELKRGELALAKQMTDNYAKLQKDGLASLSEFTRRQLEVSQMTSEVEKLETEQRETRMAVEKLAHESAVRQAEYRENERRLKEELEKNAIRQAVLKDNLAESVGNEVAVLAPCSGTVLGLKVKASGAVIHEGEVLCELACAGEQLQAEMTIPESGIGRIKTGQGVKLFYDAFPYQRYGVRYGSLRWITPASPTPSFRALVEIQDDSIWANDQARQLLPGMTGKSEIVVGRRSLISYAFEPIRQLKESLAGVP